MEMDEGLRSSLDFQIREAKSRAELFSKSLQDARAQEAIALKLLEQERERWTHSFEEKSILIEQLERELTSTVEALDAERSTDKPRVSTIGNDQIRPLEDAEIGRSFHEMMSDVNDHLPSAVHRSKDWQTQSSRSPRFNDRTPQRHGAPSPEYVAHATTDRSNQTARNYHHHSEPLPATATWRAESPAAQPLPQSVSTTEDSSVWRDLLAQYQEQLKHTKSELVACAEDRDHARRLVSRLEKQVAQLSEEKELFARASENAEGKLKFRMAQIIECEEEKEALAKRVGELSNLNADLQNSLGGLRHELAVANAELRVHANRNLFLEEQASRRGVDPAGHAGAHTTSHTAHAHSSNHRSDHDDQSHHTNQHGHHGHDHQQQHHDPHHHSHSRSQQVPKGGVDHGVQTSEPAITAAARRSIQATEAYVKDLHQQLDEAHRSYEAQLEEAHRHAAQLQRQVEASKEQEHLVRQQLRAAEEASERYRSERDALLTMLSKLHLSGGNLHPYDAHAVHEHHHAGRHHAHEGVHSHHHHVGIYGQDALSLPPPPQQVHSPAFRSPHADRVQPSSTDNEHHHHPAAHHVAFREEQHHDAGQHQHGASGAHDQVEDNERKEVKSQHQPLPLPAPSHTEHTNTAASEPSIHRVPHNTPAASRDAAEEAAHQQPAVSVARSRSRDSTGPAASIEFDDSSSCRSESVGSEFSVQLGMEGGIQHGNQGASATGNVLDVSDSAIDQPTTAAQAHNANLAGMLPTALNKSGKQKISRTASTDSSKRSKNKKKVTEIKGAPGISTATSSGKAAGTPAPGAPGQSLIIRKPPTYTGASIAKVRGASPAAAEVGKVASNASASGSKAPTPKATSSKKPSRTRPAGSKTGKNATVLRPRLTSSQDSQLSAEVAQLPIPASLYDPMHQSWDSEEGTASVRSEGGAATSAQHLESVSSQPERSSFDLDAAGLTISHVGYMHQPPPSDHGSHGVASAGNRDDHLHAVGGAVHSPAAAPHSAAPHSAADLEGDVLNHTLEITRLPTQEPAFLYHDVDRLRSDSSIHSATLSVASGPSGVQGAVAPVPIVQRPKRTNYTGVTDVKISRRSRTNEGVRSSGDLLVSAPPASSAAHGRASTAPTQSLRPQVSRARTPSPMLRDPALTLPSRGTVSGSKYYTPVSYSRTSRAPTAAPAVVVTPASALRASTGSQKSNGKLKSAGRTSAGSSTSGTRKRSLLF